MEKIENKHIVLTGANSGIGHELLKQFLKREGNIIFAVDRHIDNLLSSERVIVYQCDISKRENIDAMFTAATDKLGTIDIFCANAGFAYYEEMNYEDWMRIENIFATNVFSPVYSYQKFVNNLCGRRGIFALTVSAMGMMAMPGFTLYSATKFAMTGFQEAIRFEKADNIHVISLFPVSTDTGFFKTANELEFKKPFPVQKADIVAERMLHGMEKGKTKVMPCRLFRSALVIFKIFPFVKAMYLNHELKKFKMFTESYSK